MPPILRSAPSTSARTSRPAPPQPAGGWQFRLEGSVDSCEGAADFVTDDTLADGESVQCYGQPGGVVTIQEVEPGARFVLSIDCQGAQNAVIDEANRSVTITLDPTTTPQCIFTNTYLFGSFHVRKDVTPGAPEPRVAGSSGLEGEPSASARATPTS